MSSPHQQEPDARAQEFFFQAAALHQNGQYSLAERAYGQVLQIDPGHFDALHMLGILAAQTGRLEDADDFFRRALEIFPDFPPAQNNRGTILRDLKRQDAAIACYDKAIALKPDFADAYYNRGIALQDLRRFSAAAKDYEQAISLKPRFPEAYCNLGFVLRELRQLDAALQCCDKAIAAAPNYPEAHCNKGLALKELGQFEAAVSSYDQAIALRNDFADAYFNRGITLQELNRLDAALESYDGAIAHNRSFAEAYNNRGIVLQKLQRTDAALQSFDQTIAIAPGNAEAFSNKGLLLSGLGQNSEAMSIFDRAIELKPGFADAHNNRGIALANLNRYTESVESCRRAIQLNVASPAAYHSLGNALIAHGATDEAILNFEKALSLKPNFAEAYSSLLFQHAYNATLSPSQYLTLANRWTSACIAQQDSAPTQKKSFIRPPLNGRRLKVGYVSGDFRNHAVTYFIEQLFRNHDRARIEIFAYSTCAQHDKVTERLLSLVDHWLPVAGLSDSQLLRQIDSDSIDVLIDLSGHTAHNRLGLFACRAAPVQAHYLGYFASTGLAEIDYWIGDGILTPVETDNHFSESVWRLPRTWVSYEGKADAPACNWTPATDGTVRLGSFNSLVKLTPSTLALWAKTLLAVPEAKLFLKNRQLADPENRIRILDTMHKHGVPSNRIELMDSDATADWGDHMSYYNMLDIALDPIGAVGGGTTSCDALWMSVPLVTQIGDRMASRMTASMLNAIGHSEWIAHSESEYINTVVSLARAVDYRKSLRQTLRMEMAQSPLCDAHDLSMQLENAYFEMVRQSAYIKGRVAAS